MPRQSKHTSRRYKVATQCKYVAFLILIYFLALLPNNDAVADNTAVFITILGLLFGIIGTWMGFESHNKKYYIGKKPITDGDDEI